MQFQTLAYPRSQLGRRIVQITDLYQSTIDEAFIEFYEASISVMVTPSIGHKNKQDGSWCFFSSIKFY